MRAFAFGLLVLAGSAGTSTAGEWRFTGQTTDQAQAIDIASIRLSGQTRTFWSVSAYDVQQDDGQDFTIFQERIDCEAQTLQVLGWVDRRLDDEGYQSTVVEPESAFPIVPESLGWQKFEALCNDVWTGVAAFDSARSFALEYRRLIGSEAP
jgi:hypothetical protein